MSNVEEGGTELTAGELQRIKADVQKMVMIKMGYEVDSTTRVERNAEGQRWMDNLMSEKFRELFAKHGGEITRATNKGELAELIAEEMENLPRAA